MIYQWKEESLSFNFTGNIHVKKAIFNHKKVKLYSRDADILIMPWHDLKSVNRLDLINLFTR